MGKHSTPALKLQPQDYDVFVGLDVEPRDCAHTTWARTCATEDGTLGARKDTRGAHQPPEVTPQAARVLAVAAGEAYAYVSST